MSSEDINCMVVYIMSYIDAIQTSNWNAFNNGYVLAAAVKLVNAPSITREAGGRSIGVRGTRVSVPRVLRHWCSSY